MKRGELVAVVGAVGSGKSSLISAAIGKTHTTHTEWKDRLFHEGNTLSVIIYLSISVSPFLRRGLASVSRLSAQVSVCCAVRQSNRGDRWCGGWEWAGGQRTRRTRRTAGTDTHRHVLID